MFTLHSTVYIYFIFENILNAITLNDHSKICCTRFSFGFGMMYHLILGNIKIVAWYGNEYAVNKYKCIHLHIFDDGQRRRMNKKLF